jgi:hypothetical protein
VRQFDYLQELNRDARPTKHEIQQNIKYVGNFVVERLVSVSSAEVKSWQLQI